MTYMIDSLAAANRKTANDWLQRVGTVLLAIAGTALSACVDQTGDPAETGSIEGDSTVGSFVGTGCSTAVVLGLSKQIADEVACERPSALTHFAAGGGIAFSGSAVLPYMAPGARNDLKAAATGGGTMEVTSGFRTVAQQYLLYRWWQQGRCGITAAATPGRSNHESGRAVDLGNYSSYISRMSAHHWSHDVPGDPVHFDHLSSSDIRGADVLAFQKLWNKNHPGDKISEDGVYGPQTGSRISQAPAGGFAKGPSCGSTAMMVSARVIASPGPLAPGATGTMTIELDNTGDMPWPASTTIETSDGLASALYDPQHWSSPSIAGTIGTDLAPGATLDVEVAVIAPPSNVATHVDQAFVLDDGGTQFGMFAMTLQVVPPGADPNDDTNDASPEDENGDPVITGGCSSAGGNASPLLVIGLAFALQRRASRARSGKARAS